MNKRNSFVVVLLSFFSTFLVAQPVTMPSVAVLERRLSRFPDIFAANLPRLAEKTTIIDCLASKAVEPLEVFYIVEAALTVYGDDLGRITREVVLSQLDDVVRACLRDFPDALQELENMGIFEVGV